MEKHVIYRWSLNTKLFGPLKNVTCMDYDAAGIARKLQLEELEEI
jgi:hypothetical protein